MDHMRARSRGVGLGFGRRVRERRLAAGLSQLELGRLSRVGPKLIGQIERGTCNPSLVMMALVALDCNLTELIPKKSTSDRVVLRADAVRRAQEALAVIGSVLNPRRTNGRDHRRLLANPPLR